MRIAPILGKITQTIVLAFVATATCSAEIDKSETSPRLFFNASEVQEIQRKIEQSDQFELIADTLIEHADSFMTLDTETYPLTSAHNGMGTAGRALQKRVGILAFAGWITGEESYSRKGVEILLAAARDTAVDDQSSWQTHLQRSDAAQGFAIGYDWLFPFMTTEEQQVIREEIFEFGQHLFTEETYWGTDIPSATSCNHTSVHFGALGLCALVLGDQPEWLERAVQRVRGYFRESLDSTGYAPEGHNYYNYGLLGALPFSYALKRITGVDLPEEQPLLSESSDQMLWKWLPHKQTFLTMNDNWADLGQAGMITYPMFRYGQPAHWWVWLKTQGVEGNGTFGTGIDGYLGDGLSVPFILIWGDPDLHPLAPWEAGLPLSKFFSSGRVFARSDWKSTDAAYFAFTSGVDFHMGHNHQDENSVVFSAYGEDFLIDPGYWFKDTTCHTTMIIGGGLQTKSSAGRIIEFDEQGNGLMVRGQAAEAYSRGEPERGREHVADPGLRTTWTAPLVRNFDRTVFFGRTPQPFIIWRDDVRLEEEDTVDFIENFVLPRDAVIRVGRERFEVVGKSGNSCDFHLFTTNGASVELNQVDLSDSYFERRDRTFHRGDAMQVVQAKSRGLNAEYLVVAIPKRIDAIPPTVTLQPDSRGSILQIQWDDDTKTGFVVSESNLLAEQE